MTEEQRRRIERAIDQLLVATEVKLADLLGDQWEDVGDDTAKRNLGKEFLQAVQAGTFENLAFVRKDSANHAIYAKT